MPKDAEWTIQQHEPDHYEAMELYVKELEAHRDDLEAQLKSAKDEARDNSIEAYQYKTAFEMLVKQIMK